MKRIPRRLLTALTAAYWKKKPKPGLLHHSDRGRQYCSAAYRALQASDAMQTSMSRQGNGWEFAVRRHLHAVQSSHNAPLGSFFGTLKTESLPHYGFDTREQAKRVIFEYIEVFYNCMRHHAKINNQSPADFAIQYAINCKIAA